MDFSGWITDDSGIQIVLSKKMEKEIRAVADWLRSQRSTTKSQYTLKEWRNLVRSAFANPLTSLDLTKADAENGKTLKKLLDAAIKSAPQTLPSLFMMMGCSLFQETLPSPLAIGSVLFETKGDWLARAEQSEQISHKIRNRMERAFAGRRLAKPKDAWQDHSEKSILDVLRAHPVVCTVETKDLAPAMAKERSIIAARLAQTAIALFWQSPSNALEGFHLSVDSGCRHVATLFYAPQAKRMTGGSYLVGMPHGPSVQPKTLSGFFAEARGLLDVAGKAIECWTSTSAADKAPEILRTFAQAMFLFSEGCRETYAPMAIVKFTATLDALVEGRRAKGIKALFKARLPNSKPTAKVYGDKDMDALIQWLYDAGRSRIVHGTNAEILHDWSEVRGLSEFLTRACLISCMDWYRQHPTATKTKELLTP